MERKLLAVVAADMVGFSRLVENNEIEILKRQKKHFTDIIKPTINNYTAKIIKTTGDGFLATFESSMSAVESSLIIQRKINELEGKYNNDERIWYRFGINIGDVVIDEDDILETIPKDEYPLSTKYPDLILIFILTVLFFLLLGQLNQFLSLICFFYCSVMNEVFWRFGELSAIQTRSGTRDLQF